MSEKPYQKIAEDAVAGRSDPTMKACVNAAIYTVAMLCIGACCAGLAIQWMGVLR